MGNTSRFLHGAERQYYAYAPMDPFSGSRNFMHPPILIRMGHARGWQLGGLEANRSAKNRRKLQTIWHKNLLADGTEFVGLTLL
jgi:hypothetical protein